MNTGNISIKASVSGNTPGLKGEKGNGIKSTVLNDDYSLTFNYTNGTSDTTPPIRGQKGEKGDNGISPSITTSKSGKVTTITIKDATGTKVATINDGVDSQGDMLKSTYDKNSNGIVDNSEKVNGHTVESNVPANAKFTDTIYTHPITSGNKHIPSGGSSGQILKWEEDGTAKWDDSIEAHREGKELKVNNYKQINKFAKEGKTEQKTYTGKNLFYDTPSSTTSNGITLTKNSDGSFTLNGTTTGVSIFDFRLPKALPAGTYTFSIEGSDNIPGDVFLRARDNNGAMVETQSQVNGNNTTQNSHTFTCKKDISIVAINITRAGITFNNFVIYPQLEKGTTATKFEPYVGATPSPNPDYPQEIKNIKGVENIWFGGESTTNNGITFTKNNDGSYDITGTATASADCINLVNIANAKLKNGINYNLSINKLTNEKVSILTEAYIENWDSHVIGPLITSTTLSTNKIINIKDNITRVRYVIRVEKGQTVNIKGLKIQLEEGPIAHNFVPNGSNYLQLKNKSENLFNYTPVLITQVKSNLRTNNIYPNSNILLKKGTYILSFSDMVMKNNIKEFGVQLFDNNTQLATLTLSNNKKSAIFTINNDANISRLYTYLDNSDNNDATITYKNIQLEKGTVATDYEPYEEKNINVDLKGNELCSNLGKTTNDELIVENSKAKINKKTKEFTFTGDEEFTKRSDGDGSTTITFNLPIHEDIVELNTVSNMFSYEQSSTSGNEGMGVSIGNNKLVYIQIKRSRLSSLDVAGFKEFLKAKYNAGTPLKIQCELIEPEVVDLGEIDFDLIENSTLTCEEESDMQIDYLTIDSNIFVQDSLDGNSSQKAPSINAVNEIISKLEARIIALENKNV